MREDLARGSTVTEAIRFGVGECSMGAILVATTSSGVCAILLGGDQAKLEQDLQRRFPRAELTEGKKEFERLLTRVVKLIEVPATGFDLPLDARGTMFQRRVWQVLSEIPVGSTASYTEIAERLGSPTAARAVARACSANAIAVAIPCHRVVRSNGTFSGYRWGVERKRTLLRREAAT